MAPASPTRSRWPGRLLLAVVTAGLLAAAVPSAVSASPVDDKRAEARRIAADRARLTQDAERLNEQAKQVQDQIDALSVKIADTDRRLAAQKQDASDIGRQAAQLALYTYVRGDVGGGLGAALDTDGATALQLHRGYAPVALGGGTDLLDQAKAAQEDIAAIAATLAAQQRQQEKLRATLADRTAAVAATQTRLAATAKQVDAQLTQLVDEEQARIAAEAEAAAAAKEQARIAEENRKAAAERARQAALAATVAPTTAAASAARAATAGGAAAAAAAPTTAARRGTTPTAAAAKPGTTRPGATTPTTAAKKPAATAAPAPATAPAPRPAPVIEIPPTSPAASIAVAAALAELGKPYVFGAAGPDTFDCSGLTQWAWAKAGVSMPHYTGSQFAAFPQVPADQLQPGDLIFFSISLGHVAMYIGNGQYVHAPHTGDVVKIGSLNGRSIVGAVRPG